MKQTQKFFSVVSAILLASTLGSCGRIGFELLELEDTPPDAGLILPTWFVGPAYPQALGGMGATTLNGQIHIMGGDTTFSGNSPSTAHRTYDITSDVYTSRVPTPDNDQWRPCVVVHDGYIYSFGGWEDGGKKMRRYNPTSDNWNYLNDSLQSHVWGHACDVVGDVIYAIGGSSDTFGDIPTSQVSAYNTINDSWARMANFPSANFELAGGAVGTKIYVVGRGSNLDIYDTVANTWSSGPSLGRDAAGAGAVAHNGAFYVFGGYNSAEVDRLDFPGPVWTSLPPMSSPRTYPAVATVDNEIHVFGGFAPGDQPLSIHEYLIIP